MHSDIFSKLSGLGIKLRNNNDQLEILDPHSKLTPELLKYLKLHKPEIMMELASMTNGDKVLKLRSVEKKEYYRLSPAQTRLYLLHQFDTESLAYNMPAVYKLNGLLDRKKLTKAASELIKRHEPLRTNFMDVGSLPVQVVNENFEFILEEYDSEANIKCAITKFVRPFDIGKDILIRMGVWSDDESYLLVDIHHIVADAVSHQLLINDFTDIYNGTDDNNKPQFSYKDFAEWHYRLINKEPYLRKRKFWKNEFDAEVPLLSLPLNFPRPEIKSFDGHTITKRIVGKTFKDIVNLKKEAAATSYMLFLSAFSILLSKLSGQEDIVIGTPSVGRNTVETHKMVGVFINMLPIRLHISQKTSFKEFLEQVKKKVLAVLENQDFPYEEIVDAINPPRDASRNPLFDSVFSLDIATNDTNKSSELDLLPYETQNEVSKFDLSLLVDEIHGEFLLNFEYSTMLFKQSSVEKYLSYFENILSAVINNPLIKIGEIDLISKQELKQIQIFNRTQFEFDRAVTIIDLFRTNCMKTPDKIAVRDGGRAITYQEFNGKTDILAVNLIDRGITNNDVVAIHMERGLDFMLGVFAIMKAGAAYLPIPPSLPQKRVDFMLKDSGAVLVLTNGHDLPDYDNFNIESFEYDSQKISDFQDKTLSDSYAYVIYTSGSTGNPKGVIITQVALMNRLNWMQYKYPLDGGDVVLQKTPLNFDVSVWELFWWSISGASLSILPDGDEKDPYKLIDHIDKNNITTLHFVPPMMRLFLEVVGQNNLIKLTSVKKVFASGESLLPEEVNNFNRLLLRHNGTHLINLYGPTEATIDVTYFECYHKEVHNNIPIGKPIHNTEIYIMNGSGKQQPIGVWGELNIAGEGLSIGYINNSVLTKSKFYFHQELSRTLYKTGDIARWNNDGEIEFLGRADHQVKIRGYRIELGEIENCLRSLDKIKDVVVVNKDINGNVILCAYYTGSTEIDTGELKVILSDFLPEYMIPHFYVYLNQIPLTQNGKIDRSSLPDPVLGLQTLKQPETLLEKEIQEIWSEVLGLSKDIISSESNFFELGGNSLIATSLLARVQKKYRAQVLLAYFMKKPTIGNLAALVRKNQGVSSFQSINRAEKKEYYPLSSPQRRMYAVASLQSQSLAYNIPIFLKIKGQVDLSEFERIFQKIVQRHESLRTFFQLLDGGAVQRIVDEITFKVGFHDCKDIDPIELGKELVRPFELSEPPLLRVELLVKNQNESYLLIDMHHIISDALSIKNLTNDFINLLQNKRLRPLAVQYKDFVEWSNLQHQRQRLKKQEKFWLDQFDDDIPTINLPYDFDREKGANNNGETIRFLLDKKQSDDILHLAQANQTTSFALILSIFSLFLAKITNQSKIVIGTMSSGRNHVDKEDIVGFFVNTLPIKILVDQNNSFDTLLKHVYSNLLNAADNEDYQYESLVKKLKINRSDDRNPLFDVICVYQKDQSVNENNGHLLWEEIALESKTSKFDLGLYIQESSGLFSFDFEYSSNLFERKSILYFQQLFQNVISKILSFPKTRMGDLDLLERVDRQRLLKGLKGANTEFKSRNVYQVFEEGLSSNLDLPAIEFNARTFNYEAIKSQIDRISASIQSNFNLNRQDRVAVIMDRSPFMVCSIFAILRSHLVMVPIDSGMPEKAVEHILRDADVKLIITDDKNKPKYRQSWHTFTEGELSKEVAIKPFDTSEFVTDDLAYIIYTSGSTGQAKGVQIKHVSLLNYMLWANKYYFNDSHDNDMALFSPISFDFTLTSIFTTFLRYDKLVIYPQQKDIDEILEHMFGEDSSISFTKLTPSHVNILNHLNLAHTNIRGVILGGEDVQMHHVKQLKMLNKQIKVYNEYGPTEATIGCVVKELDISDKRITIGKPIDNTSVYIVNEFNQIQPVGVEGELCISGIQLAKGYSSVELSREKFIKLDCIQGEIVYKTGDLARYLPSGEVEYLGRNDSQIKVRGNRVELGQVEYHLNQVTGVNEAIAMGTQDPNGDTYVIAYYTSSDSIEHQTFVRMLEENLPDYMIPSIFVKIESIPLNINGKVNRKELPDPHQLIRETAANTNIEKLRQTEISLRKIWSVVLSRKEEKIGVDDNFYELGGHSISAIMLAAKIHKSLNVALTPRHIISNPTIKQQADLIQTLDVSQFKTIKKVEKKEYYPLSPGQKRMMLLDKLLSNNVTYNMPGAIMIEGSLDVSQLESAFNRLMLRHEMLRASFHFLGDQPYQKIHDGLRLRIELEELQTSLIHFEDLINEFIKPFELSQAPLFRVKLVKIDDNRHVLLYDIHHIISDGTSSTNFIKDVIELYIGNVLSPLKIQYRDYVHWQLSKLDKTEIKRQRAFWLNEFKNVAATLKLPNDMPRKGFSQNNGGEIRTTVNNRITNQLKAVALEENVTMFNVLFAAYNVLLSKFCNQSDIVIGIPSEKRDHLDLDKQIGLYLNILALRNKPEPNKSFVELLKEVKKTALNAFDNSDYQFDQLINDLNIQRIEGRSPLFDVYFNYLNFNSTISSSIEGLKFSSIEAEVQYSKYDIGFYVADSNDELEVSCVYKKDLFNKSTIESLLGAYKNLLRDITENKSKKISDYRIFEPNDGLVKKIDCKPQEKFKLFEKEDIYQPIHKRFETIAEKHPEKIAIEYNDLKLTYQELNEKINGVSNTLLRNNSFVSGCKVAILLDDRSGMVISSFGVLKTGAVYIPLDVKHPKERLQFILENSQSVILVTDSNYEQVCMEIAEELDNDIDIVNIDLLKSSSGVNPSINVKHNQLAYILYTSGSTGNPKGVMQTHRNVLHFCRVYSNRLQLNIKDKLSFLSTFSFDAGIMDIYGALLNGATLCPYDMRTQGSIRGLKKWIMDSGITIYHSIPSLFRSLYGSLFDDEILLPLRFVVLGGEATYMVDVEGFKRHCGDDCILINGLGPTESTVTLQKFIDKRTQLLANTVTIGQPVEETDIILVNEFGDEAQVYEEGEIVYKSEYLALGYFNDPEKTKTSFSQAENDSIRTYRSGDIGRRLPNNEIEYIGRKDFQTKIRGFRVELPEIEQHLLAYPLIDECVVIAKETEKDKFLVAFYKSNRKAKKAELRSFLSSKLPDYMFPDYFVQLDEIPKNNNGKVDRQALLRITIDDFSAPEQLDLPHTDLERKIADLWCEFLEIDRVGINENFFNKGGHSLKAVQLCNEIFKVLNVDLSLQEFFARPTVKLLSEYVEAQNWVASKSRGNDMDRTELIIS
ncbi:hypothetical protein GCM10009122_39070 [Fulvivirga kasyanovii]|uniref:Amino acid adenylation domain-containing protein n=1 Tax=Fulvivirga kasyanovii TaxID=396812 RepID=A0ABW9RX88_9BACT|nr:non-ribosomal peptide synthetase [Fulvivirga kasyanovii]MTI27630.1 amino acid adenylation domain-containing protein [Fulvivirga kasyanovii]